MQTTRSLRASLAFSTAILLGAPGLAQAQTSGAELERRVAELEAALAAVKSELATARAKDSAAEDRIMRLEKQPDAPAA
jgi:BMFP domain-containing protein YqiC